MSESQTPSPIEPWYRQIKSSGSRISKESFFYSRLLPGMLIGLGLLTALLILVATGVLIGVIPYR